MALDLAALKAQYDRDGYLAIENFFPDEFVQEIRDATNGFVDAVAAEKLDGELLDAITDEEGVKRLRRIGSPEKFADIYDRAMRHEPLMDLVATLLDGTVRFDHGKLNFKPPSGGAAVEWHQDWAFYPQTNDDMLAVGIMLEDCTPENGPLMVVPGSHKGPVFDHHQNGSFVGGIRASELGGILDQAVPLTAPAGSISIHHVRTLHGSTANRSSTNRPLLLFNYVAVDAFPVFNSFEWEEFNSRILRGDETYAPRLAPVPARVPNPTPKPKDGYATGSLFHLQEGMEESLYQEVAT